MLILTKAEDKAFKIFMEVNCSKSESIKYYIDAVHTFENSYKPLKDMGFDKFLLAICNGYEVEKDLGEILYALAEHFNSDYNDLSVKEYHRLVMEAIKNDTEKR